MYKKLEEDKEALKKQFQEIQERMEQNALKKMEEYEKIKNKRENFLEKTDFNKKNMQKIRQNYIDRIFEKERNTFDKRTKKDQILELQKITISYIFYLILGNKILLHKCLLKKN